MEESQAQDGTRTRGRRAKVLVDREFQLRFITRLGGLLFFYLLLFLLISVVAPVAFTFLGDPPEWALTETAFRVEVLLRLILAPLVCTFLCLFCHGVLETFKVAGPNYRYKAVLRDLARFRVPRGVRTRKGDYLRETTDAFDQALTTIHDHVREMQRMSRDAAAKVTDALVDARNVEASRAALLAVKQIEEALARYTLLSRAPECRPVPLEERPVEPCETASGADEPAEAANAPAQTSS